MPKGLALEDDELFINLYKGSFKLDILRVHLFICQGSMDLSKGLALDILYVG